MGAGIVAGVLVLSGGAVSIASAVGGDGDEVTGAAADRARAAAVRTVPGGTADAVEVENEGGNAAYGVTVTKPDHGTVEVFLDKDFHVLGTGVPDRDPDGDDG
ncbi:hypothetical protein HFP15_29055 [Amycolatopsis sp. K13G38]|uniref:PepSY domain-containing protein n=1 Tax=Amycolatopsis acididurans TaxID=2724524 RepID=A0ABX1JEK0_9PSEU|nr:hypothetical protein [Amycolatopsis acididurans]